MDLQEISEFIRSVGFPSFACIIMYVQNHNFQKTLATIQVTMQKMTDEITYLSNKVNENDNKRV